MQSFPPDIGCRSFARLADDHADGRLSGAPRAACERHLLHCPGCRGMARRQRLVLWALARMRETPASAGSREAALAAFRRHRAPSGTRNTGRQR